MNYTRQNGNFLLAFITLFTITNITLCSYKEETDDTRETANFVFVESGSESGSNGSEVITPEESQSSSPKNIETESTSVTPGKSPLDDSVDSFETYRSFNRSECVSIEIMQSDEDSLCPDRNLICCRNFCVIISCLPCLFVHAALKILCS